LEEDSMFKRPLVRTFAALSLAMMVFFAAASPARAWAANPGDSGLSFWSSFLFEISSWFAGEAGLEKTGTTGGGTGAGTNGGGPTPLSCPPSNPGCSTNENDNGTGANPLGRP
jgi:hypothetical protein